MSITTLVTEGNVDHFITKSSMETVSPCVSLRDVHDSIGGTEPKFAWHSTKLSSKMECWVLAGLEDHIPVSVSCAGLLMETASRPHGTYLGGRQRLPSEYVQSKTQTTLNHKVKQYWVFRSRRGIDGELGFLMKGIEDSTHAIVREAFEMESNESVDEMRKKWNIPEQGDRYVIEHPLVAFQSVINRREDGVDKDGDSTVSLPSDLADAMSNNHGECDLAGKSWMKLFEVPGRPHVLYRAGSFHDPKASVQACSEEEDWHQPGDIIWFTGTIHCIINCMEGRYRGWEVEWRPESMIRIAKQKTSTAPTTSKKRRANGDLVAAPLKRARLDSIVTPTLPKQSTSTHISPPLFPLPSPSVTTDAEMRHSNNDHLSSQESLAISTEEPPASPSPTASVSSVDDCAIPLSKAFISDTAKEEKPFEWDESDLSEASIQSPRRIRGAKGKNRLRRT